MPAPRVQSHNRHSQNPTRPDADKVHNLRTSSVVPVVAPPTPEALGTRALAESRASWTRLRRRSFMVLVPPGPEEPEHLLRAACVEIKFQAPHAIDATLSSEPPLLDGV